LFLLILYVSGHPKSMIQTVAIGKCFVKKPKQHRVSNNKQKQPHHKKVTKIKNKKSSELKDTKQKQSNKTTT
jgi:hypothetical protein